MIAYKGFTQEMTARLGKGNMLFQPGVLYRENASKTVREGFHCCENPFECLTYYPLHSGNRYWQVEASGSIDEDGEERIACTELKLLRELGIRQLAGYGMEYIVKHPLRADWKQSGTGIMVAADRAEGKREGDIAIARGRQPRVWGVEGAICGLLMEDENGLIISARLFVMGWQQAGKWYTIDTQRNLKEVSDEKKGN